MDSKSLLKKYYSRLVKESLIKAFMLGLVVGFSILLLTGAVWWFAALKAFWLCFIFFTAAVAASTPIFYCKFFRPTVKQTAKRIDSLGLDERVLTMTELERETSFIAGRQREDATSALKSINEKLVRLTVSVSLIIALAISGLFGTGMITVAALSEQGIITSGKDIVSPPDGPQSYELKYEVRGQGTIEGDRTQIIEEGDDATPVVAVPDDEWVFAGWSDGLNDPYRCDINVSADKRVFAVFEPLDENLYQDEGDSADLPEEGGGGSGGGSGMGDGLYVDNNYIIDNETYYGGSVYDNAYKDAMDELANDAGSSTGQKDIIEDYFKTIAK